MIEVILEEMISYKRNVRFVLCMSCFFVLTSCGKDQKDVTKTIGNDGDQINAESLQEPREDEKKEQIEIEGKKEEVIAVRIDWEQIFVDDEKCDDLEELKEKIIVSECKEIEFVHKDASKKMKDAVDEVLKDMENVLDIKIIYIDN